MRNLVLMIIGIIVIHDVFFAKYTVYTNNLLSTGYDHVYSAPYSNSFEECMDDLSIIAARERADSYEYKTKNGRMFSCVKETIL